MIGAIERLSNSKGLKLLRLKDSCHSSRSQRRLRPPHFLKGGFGQVIAMIDKYYNIPAQWDIFIKEGTNSIQDGYREALVKLKTVQG